jgi:ornithine carbamoyltransferase
MPATSSTTSLQWPADLLRAGDLTRGALDELLALAARMQGDRAAWISTFAGDALACLYEVPTTRAGLSAQAAAHRLGLAAITVRPGDLRRGGGERLEDVAEILSGWSAAIVVRDLPDVQLQTLARVARVPVINAVSPEHHPCQAIADLLTLRERRRTLDGLVLAHVGMADNVRRSIMQAGAMAGMEVRVAAPPDLAPDPEDVEAAQLLGDLHGGSVRVVVDAREAVDGADAVSTSPWPDPGDDVARTRLHERLRPYRVSEALLHRAKHDAVVLHSLPVHRGEEVAAAVVDGPRSVLWRAAANRVPAEQAVLYALINAAHDQERHG